MNTRRLLVFLPLALLAFLLQSSLWVPTSSSQAKGNPERLDTFIQVSISDPKLLNPAISSDSASSDVTYRRVFEGLIDSDEQLNLKPRLAERWEQREEAFLAEVPERQLANGQSATAAALLDRLRQALASGELAWLAPSLEGLSLEVPHERAVAESVVRPGKNGKPEPYTITGKVSVPARVKLRLNRVLPELFEQLKPTLGAAYFEGYPFEARFHLDKPAELPELRPTIEDVLAIGEHNPVIIFYVRKGVLFHDGYPLTAQDVKFTYEAIIDAKNASPRASSFDPIREFSLIDDYTVRVVYRRLYSPALIDWSMEILPEHLLNKAAMAREMERRRLSPDARKTFSMRNTEFNRSPIGTGPFRFVDWKPEAYVHLARNAQYWGPKPEYRDVYIRSIPDYLTQELELRVGAIDYYEPLPHQAARYRADPRFQVLSGSEGYYQYIGYNLRRPLFQDIRVRRALSMAIDVDAIIASVLSGEGKRTTGTFYSYTPYYDHSIKPVPYDPEAAAQLLREAGWRKNRAGLLEKDGKVFEFALITNNANQQRKSVMTVAQEAWRKLGIRVTTQAFEWTVFLEDFIEPNKFDAYVLGWVGGDINPDKYQIWHSSQTDAYELNHIGFKSPEADRLLERIRQEYDRDRQIELARELHRLIASLNPCTFLYEPTRPYVLDARIATVNRDAEGRETYSKLTPSPGGEAFYYFDRWRKLRTWPQLAER